MVEDLSRQSFVEYTRNSSSQGTISIDDRRNELVRRQIESAQYVADMILELRNVAKAAELWRVLVPLEFAYYESYAVANRVEVPPEELERLRQLSKVGAAIAEKVGNL